MLNMWYYQKNINYKNHFNKVININYGTNKDVKHTRGIFEGISDKNKDGIYSINIIYPFLVERHVICSNLINSIYIDNSIKTISNFKNFKNYLILKLNPDIVNFVIFKYLKKDLIFL